MNEGGCRRRALVAAVCWSCCLSPGVLAQPALPPVGNVSFVGAHRTTDAYMLSLVRSRPGTPFDQDALDADVIRLLRSGKFLSVTSSTTTVADRVDIEFRVVERPTIQIITFQGNDAISDGTLTKKVAIEPGAPFDAFSVREGRDNILQAYRDKGYGYATVQVDSEAARSSGELIYVIDEGPIVRVREIAYEGVTVFTPRTLKKQIQSRTAWWLFRTGAYDSETATDDAAALQRFYRGEGFLDARVSHRVDPGDKPGDLRLVFTVVEGEPYLIESIRFQGNDVLTDEALLEEIKSRPMVVARGDQLEADLESLRTAYGRQGYIYRSVSAERVFSSTPGFVIVTFRIAEGERVDVGRVVVRGNETTQDKVVRRTLQLYPGDVFDLTLAQEAEKKLRASQIFERASVVPVGNQPGVRDVLVDVTETESTNDLVFGFGVTSNSGLVGSILLDIKNFDLFDTPRTFSELFKFRAFRGAGQRLRLELQPGTELNRFRIDFTEPYLFDRPLRFDLSGYHFTRIREGYDERRTGTSASFGKRLEEGLGAAAYFKGWYGEITFRSEYVKVDELDIFEDSIVRDVEGGNFLTSVRTSLVRDRTDNRFLPSSGDRLTLSYEQFVGDFNFAKARARYARHYTLRTDKQDRKSVLSLRGGVGTVLGTAPVFERFYAGGIGSIRGFEFRGVGPRGGLSRNPLGGDFVLTTTAEYSFPLVGELLRGAVFTDMGTVEENIELRSWRASIGFGVRMTVELFGPVPIELDFAIPVLRDRDDEERVFSFFIGGSF